MSYKHRISTYEGATALSVPVTADSGLRVVVGTAPINMAKDPDKVTNTPILVTSFQEAAEKLGYSDDFESFTLCEMMDASFRVFNVAPFVLINVLDPKKHVKDFSNTSIAVSQKTATIEDKGLLLSSLVVKSAAPGGATLVAGTDYVATLNSAGAVEITLLGTANASGVTALSVTGKQIDPTKVKKEDVLGGYDAQTGKDSGLEVIRTVYPKLGMVPGILLAPKWSKEPTIAAALLAKTEDLNGLFTCECYADIDTATAKSYTALKKAKDDMGFQGAHGVLGWPLLKLGEKTYHFSTILACTTVQCDLNHGNIPYKSPSNEPVKVAATVLSDGTEVFLDVPQAEVVNSYGIVTAINDGGWKSYGNNTAAYPGTTDPKDRWIACRRMMSWYRNHFILTYRDKIDSPASYREIEALVNSENIFLNSLKASGVIAGGTISFNEEENPTTEIMNGHIHFKTKIAFWTPAEFIEDQIEFDPTLISSALGGN